MHSEQPIQTFTDLEETCMLFLTHPPVKLTFTSGIHITDSSTIYLHIENMQTQTFIACSTQLLYQTQHLLQQGMEKQPNNNKKN
jgi:predicted metal-dependent RNase